MFDTRSYNVYRYVYAPSSGKSESDILKTTIGSVQSLF